MLDSAETPAPAPVGSEPVSPEGASRDEHQKKALRRKTVKFVVVFMVSVFVLLFGYELARWSKPNDWYLLQVARSTTFLLKRVGYSCELGNAARFRGREAMVRASFEAWRRGEEAPEPQSIGSLKPGTSPVPSGNGIHAEPPLTAWEAWEYQAETYRRSMAQAKQELETIQSDTALAEPERTQRIQAAEMKLTQMKQRDIGPLVAFVFKASPQRRLADAKARLAEVENDGSLPPDMRQTRIGAASAEVAQLEAEAKQADASAQGDQNVQRDIGFSFVVIPDCGAVQSMAIFMSAILAFPARWWKRLVGILVGLPILYWVNAFRLAFLAVIGALDHGGKWFKFTHEYIWQGIYIVFVVALWMAWVEFLVRRRST
jgi:exosortase/archaeosortase family protein